LARAQAAELAIRDLARVVGEVLDRWEGEPLLERVPYIYGGNPAEVAAIARRMAGIVGAPVPVERSWKRSTFLEERDMPDALSGLDFGWTRQAVITTLRTG
jgi:hypothetical protein